MKTLRPGKARGITAINCKKGKHIMNQNTVTIPGCPALTKLLASATPGPYQIRDQKTALVMVGVAGAAITYFGPDKYSRQNARLLALAPELGPLAAALAEAHEIINGLLSTGRFDRKDSLQFIGRADRLNARAVLARLEQRAGQ